VTKRDEDSRRPLMSKGADHEHRPDDEDEADQAH
jgi:hypothetical protein